jgi:hypothetical protein
VVTNQNEGDIFTSPAQIIANDLTIEDYISQLAPLLDKTSVQQAAALYKGIGVTNVTQQAALAIGDGGAFNTLRVLSHLTDLKCVVTIVCPSFFVVEAFGNTAWMVRLPTPTVP